MNPVMVFYGSPGCLPDSTYGPFGTFEAASESAHFNYDLSFEQSSALWDDAGIWIDDGKRLTIEPVDEFDLTVADHEEWEDALNDCYAKSFGERDQRALYVHEPLSGRSITDESIRSRIADKEGSPRGIEILSIRPVQVREGECVAVVYLVSHEE